MAEATNPSGDEKICTVCKVGSEESILLYGTHQGKDVWVCVHCLPMLIHGAH